MLKKLIEEINSCGVVFSIRVPSKNKREFTSLTGTERKKLLKLLPEKLKNCQPGQYTEKVKKLWEVSS